MKILYVCARFPYPPLKGDQVRGYHQLRLLSQNHEITLISLIDNPNASEQIETLKSLGINVITFPIKRIEAIKRVFQGVFSKYPLQTLMHYSDALSQTLRDQVSTGKFDLAHIQLARMALYHKDITPLPCVIDLIDALSVNMKRRYLKERFPKKIAAYIEWKRMTQYERIVCAKFDQCTIVSQEDRSAIGNFSNLHINANGVDLGKFFFNNNSLDERKKNTLVFTGNMSYFPNVNAMQWFTINVLPIIKSRITDIQLHIVGVNPHPSLLQLARDNSCIVVVGYVDNIQSYISQSAVAIVPMQSGSGMQFKVIESMACGTPVVATSFALGGIKVQHEEHLLIANDPAQFAEQIISLLQDPILYQRLIHRSRKLVEQCYTWERTVEDLEKIHRLAVNKIKRN